MGVCVFVSGLHLYAKRLSGDPPARTGLEGAQGQTSVRIKGRIVLSSALISVEEVNEQCSRLS